MKRYILCVLVALFFVQWAAAKGRVKGKIVDENGKPLANVNVLIEQTNQGTTTDEGGVFIIDNINLGSYDLFVSMVGYESREISFRLQKEQKTIPAIILTSQLNNLNEVFILSSAGDRTKKTSSSLRLRTPIKALPQNIQVVNSEILENQQLTNMLDGVIRNVSGVSPIEHWGHFARINMRGFRLPAFRNGVNIEDSWGPLSEDMFMVDRIEFVKGPSGFMMAAGEPGGFYNVVTKKPTMKKIAKLSLVAGTQDTYRGAADFGGKLDESGRLLYRANVMYQKAGSHRKFEKTSRWGIAPSLSYTIANKTTLLAEYSYQKAESYIGSAYIFAPVAKGYASLDRDFTMIDSKYPKTDIREMSFLGKITHNFNENWSLEAKYVMMDYDQEGYSTWTYSIKDNGDADRWVNGWDAISKGNYYQIYANGKFNTGALVHKVLAGFDYTDKTYWADFSQRKSIDGKIPFNIYRPVYGNKKMPKFDRSVRLKDRDKVSKYITEVQSFYVQDELSFMQNKIRLTLAARHTRLVSERKSGKKPKNGKEITKITPRVGLSIDVTPQLSLYGLYDQSFLASKIDQKDVRVGTDINPIEGDIYEGGAKASFLKGKLKASISGYLITKNNLKAGDLNSVNPETGQPYTVQLGEVESKGFEFDLQGQITKQLSVLLNYANTNVEVTKDTDPKKIGKNIPGHAKHITNAWLSYNFSEKSILKGFGLSLGYQYQVDRSSWSWGAGNKTDLPNYFRMDGAITWSNEKLRVGLNINNILNEYLYSGANYGSYLYWQSEPGINGKLSVSYTL